MYSETTLIHHVNVFDGVDGGLKQDWSILLSNGQVEWIGPASDAPETGEAVRIVNGRGHTATPGLIDCHIHLSAEAGPDFAGQLTSDSIPRAVLRSAKHALDELRSGVTTCRDCGAANNVVIELAKAIEDKLILGPRVLAAGRVITMTGGHCFYIGREADGVDGVRAATRREIKAGADFIKVMATGGVLTKQVSANQVALTLPELSTIVDEAHNAGKKVTCHAIGRTGIYNAIAAGADSIEHGMHLDDEIVQMMLDGDRYLVPTLHALDAEIEAGNHGHLEEWLHQKAIRESADHRESFKLALAAGVNIAAGTDSGIPFYPAGGIALEIAAMVRLGMTNEAALISATSGAAKHLGISDETGTLQVGKSADVLIVDGNPLEDINAMTSVVSVFTRGLRIDPDDPALVN